MHRRCFQHGLRNLLIHISLGLGVYLRSGVPVDSHPNAAVVASLMANIKAQPGHWVAIGDWNMAPEELLSSNILSELQAYPVVTGRATCDSGNELDFSYFTSNLLRSRRKYFQNGFYPPPSTFMPDHCPYQPSRPFGGQLNMFS